MSTRGKRKERYIAYIESQSHDRNLLFSRDELAQLICMELRLGYRIRRHGREMDESLSFASIWWS
jgi:hypothetical protein